MTVSESSAVIQFFAALFTLLAESWQYSLPGRFFHRIGGAIRRGVERSSICQFVWREGSVPRGWPHSLSCRLFTAILNLPCALFKWLYKAGRRVWDGSLAFRLISGLGGATFVFLGLFILVMLVAPFEIWNNAYGLVGAAALTALFVVGSAARPRRRLELDRLGPYMTLYMAFVCCALLSSLSTRHSMRFFGFHLTAFLLVLLVVSSVRKYEQIQLIAVLAVAGMFVAALYGCYQGYIGVDIVPSQQDMTVNVGMPGRVYSFFDNPNNFAELLVMIIPLDFVLFLNAKSWRGKLAAFAALIPCVAALGLTYSRSSWLGLCLAIVLFLAFQNWRLIPLLIVLGLCALPFLPETIYNRLLTIGNMKDSSTRYRFEIYAATSNLMRDHWFRGVGLGTDVMQEVFKQYPTMTNGAWPIHTHNNYLQIWGETGIFGLLTYAALILSQLKASVKTFCVCTDRRVKNLLSAAVAGFCGISLVGVAEYTWFFPRNMFVYWFLFGVIGATIKLGRMHVEKSAGSNENQR